MFLKALEDAQAGRHIPIAAVAVDPGNLRVITGEDLRPAGLSVGSTGDDVDIHQGSFCGEGLQGGQLPAGQTFLHVGPLGTVPTNEDDIPRWSLPTRLRKPEACQASNGQQKPR